MNLLQLNFYLCELLIVNFIKLAVILNFLYLSYFLYRLLFTLAKCQLDVLEVLWEEKMPNFSTRKSSFMDFISARDVMIRGSLCWGDEGSKSCFDSDEPEFEMPDVDKLRKRRSCVKCGKKVKHPRRNLTH